MPGDLTADQVREAAKQIAEGLEKQQPSLVVSQMTKAKRPGKVLLDWSQNTGSKTTISPYSLRGTDRPFVAAPRTWEEVEAGADESGSLVQLTADQVLQRVTTMGDVFGDQLS